MTAEELRTALSGTAADPAWLADALSRVAASPAAIGGLFPAIRAGRVPVATALRAV